MASSLLDRVKRLPPKTPDAFIAEAENGAALLEKPAAEPAGQGTSTTAATDAPPAARGRRIAKGDPRKFEVPRYTFNLRLNDYELELLRTLAEDKRESMQKIVKAGLIPYLEGLNKKA